jgi:hypothetical protein
MRKVLFTLGSVMLVAAAAAVYFVIFRLDSVVETRIESVGSKAFGSRVEVGGVDTNLRDGTLSVARISVANPTGFDSPYAVRLNALRAAVDYKGLEIKQVAIENPEFYVEELHGKTNFEQMLQALDSRSTPVGADSGSTEPVITIRHLRIDQTRAAFASHTFDKYTDMQVDAMEMNNLRGTPSQLAQQIARKVVTELSSEAGAEMLKARAQKKVDDIQKKVNDKLQDLLGGNSEKDTRAD